MSNEEDHLKGFETPLTLTSCLNAHAQMDRDNGLNPLQMPEILQKIFEYLTLTDLKSIRTSCKLWNSEATCKLLQKFWIRPSSNYCNYTFETIEEDIEEILINELNDAFHSNFNDGYLNPENPSHLLFRETFEKEFKSEFKNQLKSEEKKRKEKASEILQKFIAVTQPQPQSENKSESYKFNLAASSFKEIDFLNGLHLPFERVRKLNVGFCICFIEHDVVKLGFQNINSLLSNCISLEVLESNLSFLKDPQSNSDDRADHREEYLRTKFGFRNLKVIKFGAECYSISSSTVQGFQQFAMSAQATLKGPHHNKWGKPTKILKPLNSTLTFDWQMARLRIEMDSNDSIELCRQSFERISEYLKDLQINIWVDEENPPENSIENSNIWSDNWYIPLSLEQLIKLEIVCWGAHHFSSRKFYAIAMQLKKLKSLKISGCAIVSQENESEGPGQEIFFSKSLENLELGFQDLRPLLNKKTLCCSIPTSISFKVYPNLKCLTMTLRRSRPYINFIQIILKGIFTDLKHLQSLQLTLYFSDEFKRKLKNVKLLTWDSLLTGDANEISGSGNERSVEMQHEVEVNPSIANLQNLTSVKINDLELEGALTDKFIYKGLMKLKNLQSFHLTGHGPSNKFSSNAIQDLRNQFGPYFCFMFDSQS